MLSTMDGKDIHEGSFRVRFYADDEETGGVNVSVVELAGAALATIEAAETTLVALANTNSGLVQQLTDAGIEVDEAVSTELKAQTIREFVDLFLRSIMHEGSPGFDGLTPEAFADFVNAYIKHTVKGQPL